MVQTSNYLFKFAFIFCNMAKQEDIFKNVISHAKSVLYFSVKRNIRWFVQFMIMHKRSRIKKEHTRILEINGSNER
jgi:hypothetical protein